MTKKKRLISQIKADQILTELGDLGGAVRVRCVETGVSIRELLTSGSRAPRHVAAVRKEIYTMLHEKGWSYTAIGRALGGVDHTSVMYLIHKFGS